MAGIPHVLLGGLVFWGIFVPTLATAFYSTGERKADRGEARPSMVESNRASFLGAKSV